MPRPPRADEAGGLYHGGRKWDEEENGTGVNGT
jgi:hypothetical protein